MNRLAKRLIAGVDIQRRGDIDALRARIPEIARAEPWVVGHLYRDYSDRFACDWLAGPDVAGFRAWLLEEIWDE